MNLHPYKMYPEFIAKPARAREGFLMEIGIHVLHVLHVPPGRCRCVRKRSKQAAKEILPVLPVLLPSASSSTLDNDYARDHLVVRRRAPRSSTSWRSIDVSVARFDPPDSRSAWWNGDDDRLPEDGDRGNWLGSFSAGRSRAGGARPPDIRSAKIFPKGTAATLTQKKQPDG